MGSHPAEVSSSDLPLYISRKQAAALLGVGCQLVDKLIHAGTLPSFRIGAKTVRLRRADVIRFVESSPATKPLPVPVQHVSNRRRRA